MKTTILLLAVFAVLCIAEAQENTIQDVSRSKFRFALTYGITPMNPDQINEHIGTSNYALGSSAKSIKSLPELGATLTLRPMKDAKVLIFRAGYASVERIFDFSQPQTSVNDTQIGTIDGTITETYSFYPLSFGIGAATPNNDYQFQVEFIYGLAYVTEQTSFRTTDGYSASVTRELQSPAYGIRVGGNSTVNFTENVGLVLELSYRYLMFDEYEDDKALPVHFFEFPLTGITLSAGIAVGL
jgi:hypothetical protein